MNDFTPEDRYRVIGLYLTLALTLLAYEVLCAWV